jgi:hypothetical protein
VFVDESGAAIDGDYMADEIRDWMREVGPDRRCEYTTGPLKDSFGTHCFQQSMARLPRRCRRGLSPSSTNSPELPQNLWSRGGSNP